MRYRATFLSLSEIVAFAASAALLFACVCNAPVAQAGNQRAQAAPPAGTMPYPQGIPPILLGASWYPEQWPESRWDEDLRLMEAAHIHLVRVGEFAWSRIEPREGIYDLDWLDRAIALAAKHHIVVVIGTPTDAPPAWMTQKYPDVLRVDIDGRPDQHGIRRQFSYTSPRYREFCRIVAEKLALRFGHNPNVVGWQIGNEFSFDSYDSYTRQQFQRWLAAKYKTLAALNAHWTTAYWSQTYDAWNQIPLEDTIGNPGLLLDHKRFVSDVWRDFAQNQAAAIRVHADPRQFITTNIGGLGWSDRWDHYVVTRDLDLAAWDDYVGQGHLEPYKDGAMHDLIRGLKQKNFWVMETQPGFVNWAPINNSLNKGEVRLMAWEAIGHGADAVAYWQWRSALNGQEQYHGDLVGPDGTPVPIYREIQQIGREFETVAPALQGTTPVSEVAILHSYDSRWAIDFQLHNKNYDQQQVLLDYYRPLLDLTHSIDIVSPNVPLDRYKLVVAPGLNVISDDLGRHLLDYVKNGGHLVLGPRSGMKDAFNALDIRRQPGPLEDPLGGRVEQYYALDTDVPVSGQWGSGVANIWAEALSAKESDVQVLMHYGAANGWLDHQPAAITRKVGKGTITYIGALLDPTLMDAAARWMVEIGGVDRIFGTVPKGIEVCRRTGNGHTIFILLNHTQVPMEVALPRGMRDLLNSSAVVSAVTLPVQGVAVLEDR
ncbi:MAG: beta-galactosidase [Candidatus Acidiferrales bacterium]